MNKGKEYYQAIINKEAEILQDLSLTLDWNIMDHISDMLCNVKEEKNRVITAGCGTSGIVAEKISHMLNVIEVSSFFLAPGNSVHGGLGAIQKGDIVVLVTKGGNTQEIINYIPMCKSKGATIIGVTEAEDSILGISSDILFIIKVKSEPCPWNLIASGSILACIAAWDAIIFSVMQRTNFTKEQFGLTHPGGLVGDKLRLEREIYNLKKEGENK